MEFYGTNVIIQDFSLLVGFGAEHETVLKSNFWIIAGGSLGSAQGTT